MSIGGVLGAAIKRKGWNQAEAALKLRTHPPMISMVLAGLRPVPRSKVNFWAKVLGVSPDSLVEKLPTPNALRHAKFCPTCGHKLSEKP